MTPLFKAFLALVAVAVLALALSGPASASPLADPEPWNMSVTYAAENTFDGGSHLMWGVLSFERVDADKMCNEEFALQLLKAVLPPNSKVIEGKWQCTKFAPGT